MIDKDDVESLFGNCWGCGTQALLNPLHNRHECETCTNYHNTCDGAEASLKTLTGFVIASWWSHWNKRGLGAVEAKECLERLGHDEGLQNIMANV
jgi:hypothetical protein